MPPPKPPSSFQNQDEANGNQSCPAPRRVRVFNCKTNYSELEIKDIDELINCLFQMTSYGKMEKILYRKGRKTC